MLIPVPTEPPAATGHPAAPVLPEHPATAGLYPVAGLAPAHACFVGLALVACTAGPLDAAADMQGDYHAHAAGPACAAALRLYRATGVGLLGGGAG